MSSLDVNDNKIDAAAAKLWLDYLGKLKDREDRTNQVTGITIWALYGLIGALCYKGIDVLPIIFSDKAFRFNTILLFILAANLAEIAQRGFSGLWPTIGRGASIRSMPEWLRPLLSRLIICVGILTVFWGAMELWFWHQNLHLPLIVHISLFVFGVQHLFASSATALFLAWKRWLEPIITDSLPYFSIPNAPGRRMSNALTVFNGSLCIASLVFYVRFLMQNTAAWPLLIKVALCMLILVWAIGKISLWYPARRQAADAVVGLEQQILIESLSESEIKKRFLERICGSELTDWLRQHSDIFANGYRDLQNYLSRATADMHGVCLLPDAQERLRRLELLKNNLHTEKNRLAKEFKRISLQEGAAVTVTWALGQISGKEILNLALKEKKQLEEFESQLKALFVQLDGEMQRTGDLVTTRKQDLHEMAPFS